MIRPERLTAAVDHDFVVFLIGMRFRVRQVRRWLPLFRAMPRMLAELSADPTSGYLGGQSWIGNPTIMVQYWRSFDDLERYARDTDHEHRPAWAAFNRALRSGADVGVWHEAYRVRPGDYEAVYRNMPPFGLAKATRTVPATGRRESAAGRLAAGANATEG
jgi:hypothetical protein